MAKAMIVFEEVEIMPGKNGLTISLESSPGSGPSYALVAATAALRIVLRDLSASAKRQGVNIDPHIIQLDNDITVEDGKFVRRKDGPPAE